MSNAYKYTSFRITEYRYVAIRCKANATFLNIISSECEQVLQYIGT